MFESLPHHFKKHNLSADARTLLLLRKAMDRGLIHTLGDIFLVLKGIITKDPKDFGPYTTAFYEYFLDVEIKQGERLESALLRSETFDKWKKKWIEEQKLEEAPDVKEMVDRFLDEVHLSSFEIKKILSGKDILNKDNPDQTDQNPDDNSEMPDRLEKAADYRDVSLEELKERLERVARQQRGRHRGGNHWVGQGGVSPYGNNGAAAGGIRIGGSGGGKMARMVVGNQQFYPVDMKAILKDDTIDVALASLKGIEEEAAEQKLDIPLTIKEGLKQGGIFLPYEREEINQKIQVMLLIDNGGMSMIPYVKIVRKLFSKMKRRFAHDLKTYYYHNTIYGGVYEDARRKKYVPVEKLIKLDKNYSVFVIGDADMAPYELSNQSIENWQTLEKHFHRMVWLNPLNKKYWAGADTVPILRRVVPMHPLTPHGIEEAVKEMNKKRQYSKR